MQPKKLTATHVIKQVTYPDESCELEFSFYAYGLRFYTPTKLRQHALLLVHLLPNQEVLQGCTQVTYFFVAT